MSHSVADCLSASSSVAAVGRVQAGPHESAAFVSPRVATAVHESEKRFSKQRQRVRDKADRATSQLVLDPRTRLLLHRLCVNGHLSSVHGCISTGKEAAVYYALQQQEERAVKVYKTSVLSFRDRQRYVSGEWRWRRGHCSSNPRKMVRLWAEKEMRNLKRLNAAGIPSPAPLLLKAHVLVMTFIGEKGQAAPRLRDAALSSSQLRLCYMQAVRLLRRLYHSCRLVHADLSDYNLLYHRSQLVVIDVSQAVETTHPLALQFLKADCRNVNRAFTAAAAAGGGGRAAAAGDNEGGEEREEERGVNVMRDEELFQWVMLDASMSEQEEEAWLGRMMRKERQQSGSSGSRPEDADRVFAESFVPRRLDEVVDYEREHEAAEAGSDSALHAAIRAMTVGKRRDDDEDESSAAQAEDGCDGDDLSDDSDSGSDSDGSDDGVLLADALPDTATGGFSAASPAAASAPAFTGNAAVKRPSTAERRQREREKDGRRRRGRLELGQELVHDDRDTEADDSLEAKEEGQDEQAETEETDSSEEDEEEQRADDAAAASTAPVPPADAAASRAAMRADRKAAKKAAKAMQAEKRKTKIPKKDKKKKIKASSRSRQ